MKTQDDLSKKIQNDGHKNDQSVQPKTASTNPGGQEGALTQKKDNTENVGKGGTLGGTKAVNTTPNTIQESTTPDRKSTDNLAAGEKNLTQNSTLNTVPSEPVEVKNEGPKCEHCKGEGLEDVENPTSPLCSVCKGSGRA